MILLFACLALLILLLLTPVRHVLTDGWREAQRPYTARMELLEPFLEDAQAVQAGEGALPPVRVRWTPSPERPVLTLPEIENEQLSLKLEGEAQGEPPTLVHPLTPASAQSNPGPAEEQPTAELASEQPTQRVRPEEQPEAAAPETEPKPAEQKENLEARKRPVPAPVEREEPEFDPNDISHLDPDGPSPPRAGSEGIEHLDPDGGEAG